MTELADYSSWASQDHLAMAEKLAARADDMASAERPRTMAAVHREEILQTTARVMAHARLAELKRADPIVVPALEVAEAVAPSASTAEPAATTGRRRERAGGA